MAQPVDQIHVGDIGTLFVVYIVEDDPDSDGFLPVNVATATTKEIHYWKPSGATLSKAASLLTDGSEGGLTYTSVDGDIDEAGVWKIQGFVEFVNGEWHSEVQEFRVRANLI
jgi:hypothetical protein